MSKARPATIVKNGTLTPGQYSYLHRWVSRFLGKPRICSECGTTESKNYDWANISGKYLKDLSDWKRLCRSCHRKMDFKDKPCPRGHAYTPDNVRIGVTGRHCQACDKLRSHIKKANAPKGALKGSGGENHG